MQNPNPRGLANIGSPAAQKFNGTTDGSFIVGLDLTAFSSVSISYWQNATFTESGGAIILELSANWNSNVGSFVVFSSPTIYSVGVNSGTSGATQTSANFPTPSANVWHHYLVVFFLGASGAGAIPAVYVDGVSQSLTFTATGSSARAFGNFECNIAGRNVSSAFGNFAMAQLAMYAGQLLTSASAMLLFKGADPRQAVQTGLGVTHYWPMSGAILEENLGNTQHNLNSSLIRFVGRLLAAGPPVFDNSSLLADQQLVGAAAPPATPATIPSAPQIWSPLTLGAAAWKMGKMIEENRPLTRRGLFLPRRRIAGSGE